MARPRVPISRTDYYVRGHSDLDATDPDRPLSSFLAHDELASSLGHLWLSQGQHYVNFLTPTAQSPITFTSAETASKAGNDAFAHLRSFSWICRLLPDGRPEPVRVRIAAKKGAGGDSSFYIRAHLRPYSAEPFSPWPIPGPGLRDAWNVGQAAFTSSTLAETEVDGVLSATEMYGVMQLDPREPVGLVSWQREAGIGTPDDWEPIAVPMLTLDLYGGFTGGTTGTPELHGVYVRAAAYAAKDVTAT